jgi:protein phosphatase
MKTVEIFSVSERGNVRNENQDSILIQPVHEDAVSARRSTLFLQLPDQGLLLCVADGMGGVAGGKIASELALKQLREFMLTTFPRGRACSGDSIRNTMTEGIRYANSCVLKKAMEDTDLKGMGTTLTAVYICDQTAHIFQIGDSRAYLFRTGSLCAITKDQTLVSHLLSSGLISVSQAKVHPMRHVLLQALGTSPQVIVDYTRRDLFKNDVLLLCSDGLHTEIGDGAIREISILNENRRSNVRELVTALLHRALREGGNDNISIIGVVLKTGFLPYCAEDVFLQGRQEDVQVCSLC